MNINELILYANIAGDEAAGHAAALFTQNADVGSGTDLADAIAGQACHPLASPSEGGASRWTLLQRAMASEIGHETVRATYWQNHLCALVCSSDNPFSRAAERGAYAPLEGLAGSKDILGAIGGLSETAAGLLKLATEELALIKKMYAWDFASAPGAPSGAGAGGGNIASLMASPKATPLPKGGTRRGRVHEALARGDGLASAVKLAAYYRSCGAGALEAYDSFYWDGGFRGVTSRDPIRFEDLIGVERQTAALVENTEFLLAGLPASNILLYGDAGTGKSSSVKALINEYAGSGLKLVAIPKARIAELPSVLAAVSERGLKFILFIDDLSFEENESTYKSFKSVIEGGVSARPSNAVICVTSNRRNIVKEVWKDREHQDDIHLRDNLQEKRSLSDRFGLTIVYSSPDKGEYLAIVEGLAARAELGMGENELKAAALTWELRHGGRSGRTARQFVEYMKGHEALAEGNK
ncbi:MAG: ATP-binding protein [Clostridiales Family XIII bacterium]|nr:ATP-binding protein [Clostridiales Family XIII bacterium]